MTIKEEKITRNFLEHFSALPTIQNHFLKQLLNKIKKINVIELRGFVTSGCHKQSTECPLLDTYLLLFSMLAESSPLLMD